MLDTTAERNLAVQRGIRTFKIKPGDKTPAVDRWQDAATIDWEQLRWLHSGKFNAGIRCGWQPNGRCLVALDVDNKKGVKGDESLMILDMVYGEIPATLTNLTPTGGRHLLFWSDVEVRNSASKIGSGLDVRGEGGYVVGAGSHVVADGKSVLATGDYRWANPTVAIADAPEWLIKLMCSSGSGASATPKVKPGTVAAGVELDAPHSVRLAQEWLLNDAPLSYEGCGGDDTMFRVACQVKDFGVSQAKCLELIADYLNDRCEPPWPIESDDKRDLTTKVRNAYGYGESAIGSRVINNPVEDFAAVPGADVDDFFGVMGVEPGKAAPVGADGKPMHPIDAMNLDHAVCKAGSNTMILWETVDDEGNPELTHWVSSAFHEYHNNEKLEVTRKTGKFDKEGNEIEKTEIVPVTKLWMASPTRRTYRGLVFKPGGTTEHYYNLWRGFAFEPSTTESLGGAAGKATRFIDHIRKNVCNGDKALSRWVLGWLAHMIQKPEKKPLTALVVRGGKGVGKTIISKVVGKLLGQHYMLTANRRYVVGNFNGHMESLLMFTLDEAFWSGDKQAEGMLKDLITGDYHQIEHKGHSPYKVANLTRIIIIGNEEWLVPATEDERRYAVLDVGAERKQDLAYFNSIMADMAAGGYADLLRFLMDYDLTGIDVNEAPKTSGLADQKVASLDPVHQWVMDGLREGGLQGMDIGWPSKVPSSLVRTTVLGYLRQHNIKARSPSDTELGRLLKKAVPGLKSTQARISGDASGKRYVHYLLPTLEQARADWDAWIGHPTDWADADTADDFFDQKEK